MEAVPVSDDSFTCLPGPRNVQQALLRFLPARLQLPTPGADLQPPSSLDRAKEAALREGTLLAAVRYFIIEGE